METVSWTDPDLRVVCYSGLSTHSLWPTLDRTGMARAGGGFGKERTCPVVTDKSAIPASRAGWIIGTWPLHDKRSGGLLDHGAKVVDTPAPAHPTPETPLPARAWCTAPFIVQQPHPRQEDAQDNSRHGLIDNRWNASIVGEPFRRHSLRDRKSVV